MIEVGKLNTLLPGQKRRKLALTFGALERDIDGIAEKGCEYSFHSISRAEYTKRLVEIVSKDEALPQKIRDELSALCKIEPFENVEKRACNVARNALLAALGTFPAEWDLIIAPHEKAGTVKKRDFFKNVFVYAEDIRSPFNLGSIFRTAEAMGAEKAFISENCVDPNH